MRSRDFAPPRCSRRGASRASGCPSQETLGASAITVLGPGVVNNPTNKSLRFDILKFGLERFCFEMLRRGAPLKMSDEQPVLGRFFAESCQSQVIDDESRKSFVVQYTGKGYAWIAALGMGGRVGFTLAGLIEYAPDFQLHDGAMYVYFRPRRIDATSFQTLMVESRSCRSAARMFNADEVGRRIVDGPAPARLHRDPLQRQRRNRFRAGLHPQGQRPFKPFQVRYSEKIQLANDRTEVHARQQDFIGGFEVTDDDQALYLTMSLDGAPAVDVFVVPKGIGDPMIDRYVRQSGPGTAARAAAARRAAARGPALAALRPALPKGLYYLVLDHSARGRAYAAAGAGGRRPRGQGRLPGPARRAAVRHRRPSTDANAVDPCAPRLPKDAGRERKSARPSANRPAARAYRTRRLLRYVFWAVWFVLVPARAGYARRLAAQARRTRCRPTGRDRQDALARPGPAGSRRHRALHLFEMVALSLPPRAAARRTVGLGGRSDLRREVRREYEHAAQLLDEAERILTQASRAVERDVPAERARRARPTRSTTLREAMEREAVRRSAFRRRTTSAQAGSSTRHLGRWQRASSASTRSRSASRSASRCLLRAFVVEAFKIPSGSMLPTLQIQDHIFVNKFALRADDSVHQDAAFRAPAAAVRRRDGRFDEPAESEQDFIKRVIALPGDKLEVEDGHPIINGWQRAELPGRHYEFREGDECSTKRGELFVEFLGEYSYLTLFEDDRSRGPPGAVHGEARRGLGARRQPQQLQRLARLVRRARRRRAVRQHQGPRDVRVAELRPRRGDRVGPLVDERDGAAATAQRRQPGMLSGIEKCLAERPPSDKTTPAFTAALTSGGQ